MLNFNKIYLVRHGSYNHSPEELTEEGIAQSELAGRRLLAVGVNREATLLSSDAPRALQTSAIIASVIETTVKPSTRINVIGNSPEGVESLDQMVELALAEAGVDSSGESLVVIAHQPLLEIAAFGARITTGQVVEYQPETWENPNLNAFEQNYLSKKLGAFGLA